IDAWSCRYASWSSRRKTEQGIRREDSSPNQAQAAGTDQQRPPCPITSTTQRSPHADGTRNGEQPCDHEVRHLNPASISETQQTERVLSDVKATASEHLGHAREIEQRPEY